MNFSFDVIALVVIVGTVSHLALVFGSRWANPLFLIAGAFCFLSPLSAAPELPYVGLAKYGRVYATLLLLFVGFFIQRLYHLRASAWALLFFVGFYVLAGLWSDAPMAALKYKGLYGLAVIAGFMLAYGLRDFRDLRLGIRVLVVGGSGFVGLVFLQYLTDPLALVRNERLSFYDLNPNRIGLELAPIVILSAYMALYDTMKAWRRIGYVVGTVAGVMLMFTGSRGAAGEALLGCFFVTIPMLRRRPGLLLFLGLFVGVTVLIALSRSQIEGTERLLDPSLENRQGIWTAAIEHFRESPLFGQGWVYNVVGDSFSTANMHSIYLQTLAEAGILGGILMAIAIVYILFSAIRLPHYLRSVGAPVPSAFLALGFVVALFAHGVIEAATTRGSNLNALMLAFAVGLLDRVPELLTADPEAAIWLRDSDDEYVTAYGWPEEASQPTSSVY